LLKNTRSLKWATASKSEINSSIVAIAVVNMMKKSWQECPGKKQKQAEQLITGIK